jgi:hypothetical protein
MDDNFINEGIIKIGNQEDKKICRKFWFITYYNDRYDNDKFLGKVTEKLNSFPHMENFVFQLEEDQEKDKHVNIAIGLDDKRSKPVVQLVKRFPDSIIQYIDDIEAAREYCSKKYSRVEGTKPIFHGITKEEKEKLISLGKEERHIELIINKVNRKLAKIIAEKRDIDNIDFNEYKEVELLRAKAEDGKIEEEDIRETKYKIYKEAIVTISEAKEVIEKAVNKTKDKEIEKFKFKIGNILERLATQEEENKIKALKERKNKRVVKRGTTKINKADKKQSKVYKQIEENIKETKSGINCFKDTIKNLNADIETLFHNKKFTRQQLEAKITEGKDLDYNEKEVQKKMVSLNLLISKYAKSMEDSREIVKNLEEKLEKEDKSCTVDHLCSSSEDDSSVELKEVQSPPLKMESFLSKTRKNKQFKEKKEKVYKNEVEELIEENKQLNEKLVEERVKYQLIIDGLKKTIKVMEGKIDLFYKEEIDKS